MMTRDVCSLAVAALASAGIGLAVQAGWWFVAVACALEVVAAMAKTEDER